MAERRRRTWKPAVADKISGVLAHSDSGACPVCDALIIQGQRIVQRKGAWVHVGCVAGGDDQ